MPKTPKRAKVKPSDGRPEPLNPEWSMAEKKIHLLSAFRNFACHSGMVPKYRARPHNEMCDELQSCVPNPFDSGTLDEALATANFPLSVEVGKALLKSFWTLDIRNELYMCPRGAFKTSLVKAFLLYCLLLFREMYGLEISTLYMRDSHQAAKEFLGEMKDDITRCPILLELFGDLKEEADVWSSSQINWSGQRDASVSTAGAKMGRTGTHPRLIICDDLVNDNNYTSPLKLSNAWGAITQFQGTMGPGSVRLVVGTPFTKNDCYAKLRKLNADARIKQRELQEKGEWQAAKEARPLWKEFIRSAWCEDGSLFFPDMISEEFLRMKKRSLEEEGRQKMYSSWFLMTPTVEGEELFLPEYEQWGTFFYQALPKPEIRVADAFGTLGPPIPVNTYMRVDPALTAKSGSHKHGVVVMCTDADNNKYVLFAKGYRLAPSQVSIELCKIIHRFLPPVVIIENEMSDAGMVARLMEYIKDNNLAVKINPSDIGATRTNKALRIRALQPWYFQRKVWWQRGGAVDDLKAQYEIWPDIEDGHADVLDAHAGMVGWAVPYTGDPMREEKLSHQKRLEYLMKEVTEEEEFGDLVYKWASNTPRTTKTGVR